MQVRMIDTSSSHDVKRFVCLPFRLYRSCLQWVPPIVSDMRLALDRDRYPFYTHSTADFFVAEKEDEVVGRMAVIDNRPYNVYHDTKTAFFYYFEAVEDTKVVEGLFDAAFDWARARGLEEMMGPRGLLRGDGHGLLVEGFEHRPAMGIPYNPPYYGKLLEALGFEKELDFLSAYLGDGFEVPQRLFEIAERVKERRGFRVESFQSKRELRQWVPEVQRVNNEAFAGIWGYYPIGEAEARAIAERFLAAADPRLIKLVTKDDEVVGFVIAYPDVSAGIKRANGRFWPLGWLHLLIESKRTKWINFNGVGILPQHQGAGASAVLYAELAKTVLGFRFEHADLVQVAEDNVESRGEVEGLGGEWYKRHRIYRRTL